MTTWIFLRGLVREGGHWGAFVPVFKAQMPDTRVHLLDLPGNGELSERISPSSVSAMVDAVRLQLQADGVAPPYAVLALSMGGMVAVNWAHRFPGDIERQVLINTSMRPFSSFYQRLQPRNWATIAGLLLTNASGQKMGAGHFANDHDAAPPGCLAGLESLRQANPVSTMNALRQLWAAARFAAPSAAPAIPTLLLASAQDALVSVQCSRAIAQAWGVPLHEHRLAGHDLSLDDPHWVAQQVQAWLPRRVL